MTVAVNSDPTLPAYDTISYSRLGLPAPPGPARSRLGPPAPPGPAAHPRVLYPRVLNLAPFLLLRDVTPHDRHAGRRTHARNMISCHHGIGINGDRHAVESLASQSLLCLFVDSTKKPSRLWEAPPELARPEHRPHKLPRSKCGSSTERTSARGANAARVPNAQAPPELMWLEYRTHKLPRSECGSSTERTSSRGANVARVPNTQAPPEQFGQYLLRGGS